MTAVDGLNGKPVGTEVKGSYGSISNVDPLQSPCERWGSGAETWRDAAPIAPGEGMDSNWLSLFPLRTRGRHVVDAKGDRFRLCGVNWYGASDMKHVVGGLDVQSMHVICKTIRELGFSVVRLPFSNEMLRSSVPEGAIDFTRNPSLKGLTALEVFDAVIQCLGQHRVAVILNNHTTYGEWCGGPDRNGLWFEPGGHHNERCWLDDWEALARRYSKCPYVVGYDLRNEVRFCPPRAGSLSSCVLRWPAWGAGRVDHWLGACCWATAARTCGVMILAAKPDALIIVERIIWPQRSVQSYVELLPELKDRLILGVHHYGWSGPGRYLPSFSPLRRWPVLLGVLRACGIFGRKNYGEMESEQLQQQLLEEWGCLLESNACPVWVSEFGADANNEDEMRFFRNFVSALEAADADWAYWPLNVGPKPGCGGDEPYGMLAPDWTPKPGGDSRLSLLATLSGQASSSTTTSGCN